MTPPENSLNGKRIALIFGGTTFGGGERQALILARHLRTQCNADAQILPWAKPDPMVERYQEYGVPWQLCGFGGWRPATRFNMATSLVRYVARLRKLRLDLLIPFMMDANLLGGIVWRWTGAKGSIWNQVDEGRERRPGRWERLAVRQTGAFISNSVHGANFLKEKLGAPPDRVHVIYNGISMEPGVKSREQWRSQLGLGEDVFVACMVANLTPFKDHATLLRAWRIVLDRLDGKNKRAVLLLAGGLFSETSNLKIMAYDLELCGSVRFLGPVMDITGLSHASDLCVFSSRVEGSPNAVLECMATGLPVAGTDIPGLREAVGEDNVRFLAPPGDAELLAEKILLLAQDRKSRHEIGCLNRERVATVFSLERMTRDATRLIASVINDPPPTQR
jgi:glycosyltransferase involved in cell wall biosynthesis